MNTKEIEVLLEKYYEGRTSLREEKFLRGFFQGEDVPEHLVSHKPLFTFFTEEQKQEPSDVDSRLKISEFISDKPGERNVVAMHPNRKRLLYVTGIAATLLLLISLFFTYRQDIFNTGKSRSNSYNKELAYAEASETLLIVSSNLNTGLKQVSRLQMVDKAMKNIQLFNKFYQYQPIIINQDEILNQSAKSK